MELSVHCGRRDGDGLCDPLCLGGGDGVDEMSWGTEIEDRFSDHPEEGFMEEVTFEQAL